MGCDALFVVAQGLAEVFLLDRELGDVTGYHIVPVERLEELPRLRRQETRFLLRVEAWEAPFGL